MVSQLYLPLADHPGPPEPRVQLPVLPSSSPFTKTDSHSIFCSIFLEALSYISRMLITLFWASITIIARYIYKIPQYNVSQCSTLNYSTVQYLQYRVYVCVCISTPNQVYIQNQATEQEKCFVGLKKRLQMVLHSSKIGQNRTIYLSKIG